MRQLVLKSDTARLRCQACSGPSSEVPSGRESTGFSFKSAFSIFLKSPLETFRRCSDGSG